MSGKSEFENFTSHLQDKIFEETSIYLSNVIGTEDWDKEGHAIHGIIMYNAIKAIAEGILKE
ncbi:hypothetical protein DRO61_09345 [Candidatus Bathyarchaeota archaeon]|nr:MAG: hypothetical protein DRO61_09345 [Candidatus Bathyarchaeota archaeon]